ncbi:hypothetical protein ACWGIN_21935 [Streptomyces sp. NPDC054861]
MPGKNFAPPPEGAAALADSAVADLAQRLTRQMLSGGRLPGGPTPPQPQPQADGSRQALALLHVLDQVRKAAERLQQNAAADAARAGAGYPELGDACAITRQGARRRWPGLLNHSCDNPTEHR